MEMYNFEYYKHPSQKDSTLNYPPSNYYSNTIPFYNNDGSFLGQ